MRPLLRWGLGTFLALLLTVLVLVSAVLFLPSGTRFAINFTASLLPQVEVEGVDGTLASELQIKHLRFEQNELVLDLSELRLSWQPWLLTQSLLKIHELSVVRLDVSLPPSAEQEAADGGAPAGQLPELPSVTLPLTIEAERVALGHVRVVQAEQVLVDELSLSLTLRTLNNLVLIEPLIMEQPGSRLELSGWTEPSQQFLTHLELQAGTDLARWIRFDHWPEQLPLEADMVIDLDGAARNLTLSLNAELAETRLRLQSQIDGTEGIVISYQLNAQGVDTALAAPEWPGSLAVDASGRVELGNELPQVAVELNSLQGQLRQESISATASLSGDTREWQVKALKLRYAGAKADISGAVSDQLALTWALSAPNLTRLLPAASGQLELSGEISGPRLQPAIKARIRARGLAYAEQARLERISGDVALDLSGKSDWAADLQLINAEASGHTLEKVLLKLTGIPEQHQLTLTASGSPGRAELSAAGGWVAADQRWGGQLQRLELQPQPLSHWRSSAAAGLAVSPEGYQLQRLCLDELSAGGSLCVQAEGSFAGDTDVVVKLNQLAMELLAPLLNGMRLTPSLSADVLFSQQRGGKPSLTASLETSAGELTPAQADQTLSLAPIAASIELADDDLEVQARTLLEFLSGELALSLNIRGLSAAQQLRGNLKLQADDLSRVSVLVPDLQNVQGRVGGEVLLSGSLSAPELEGELNYLDGAVELPALGLVIAPLELRLNQSGLPGQVRFTAAATSGEGRLDLQGDYDLAAREGVLTLGGDNFTAMDTAEIRALISPDLQLQLGAREIRLGGSLKVPLAHISPPKTRESALKPSADVVLVKEGKVIEKEPVIPVYADLRIELGDDVRVDALGFKGRLLGALQIEESPGQATRATGSIQVESGEYRLYGQDLDIRRGSLVYTAGPVDNPGLDLRIGRQVEEVIVGADISGTLRDPRMELYGEPAMPDSSVLSYLLLGKPPSESSAGEQQMLMQAALALGMSQGNKITGKLRETLALDEFGFDSSASDESAFFIGKYLSPRLYLRYGIGVLDAVNTLSLKYKVSDKWRVEAQSSELGSGADILYTLER
ncbi:translocation/assembly module TamB domain-containing protein [Marinobacterium sediminicola]|uniref:Translocation and assembly module TamB n=1 Tax=Marinobacterium sediminicola TaxID=518898 RepID=A0ABY1RWI8_9GAMM|nr:translocation/assembly module TamB domain-containing protein [Marinobacterium sediminicola]ULG70285.1 translocation/assembly module TamB domain-containing protein [Marinobacterium sediminicola]SMR69854.1 translocation and assembly module TamB [Marinobacterium sediminicola]